MAESARDQLPSTCEAAPTPNPPAGLESLVLLCPEIQSSIAARPLFNSEPLSHSLLSSLGGVEFTERPRPFSSPTNQQARLAPPHHVESRTVLRLSSTVGRIWTSARGVAYSFNGADQSQPRLSSAVSSRLPHDSRRGRFDPSPRDQRPLQRFQHAVCAQWECWWAQQRYFAWISDPRRSASPACCLGQHSSVRDSHLAAVDTTTDQPSHKYDQLPWSFTVQPRWL